MYLSRTLYPFSHSRRIPFFFEPKFDAFIKPLPAALRITEGGPEKPGKQEKKYEPVVYGQFLLGKVTNNFDTNGVKSRYN